MQHNRSRTARRRRNLLAVLAAPLLLASAPAAGPLPVTEVAPGIFVHKGACEDVNPENRGDIANLAFIVGGAGVAVIDTGNTPDLGRRLLAAVRAETGLPVRYVVNTHMHPDHTFGNVAFADTDAAFVGAGYLEAAMRTNYPYYLRTLETFVGPAAGEKVEVVPPTITVKPGEKRTLDLGGRSLVLRGHREAHTPTDVSVYDPQTKTVFPGDLLFVERVPSLDGSLLGWLEVTEEIKKIPAVRAVPGHGPASVDWPQGIAAQTRYLELLRDEVRAIIKNKGKLEQAMETAGTAERGNWALFDDYNARNVTQAFVELEWE